MGGGRRGACARRCAARAMHKRTEAGLHDHQLAHGAGVGGERDDGLLGDVLGGRQGVGEGLEERRGDADRQLQADADLRERERGEG